MAEHVGQVAGAVRRNLGNLWFYGCLGICVALLVASCLRPEPTEMEGGAKYLLLFDLRAENNVAAWWSGILLLLNALHAYDGYALWRERAPRVARSWASLSLLLVILSADEIGSIHERIGMIAAAVSVSQWLALLPFGLIGLCLLLYTLAGLWSRQEDRRKAWLILLAFMLYGSVVGQEALEHAVNWGHGVVPAIRVVIEEGTELVASLILLRLCMGNTAGLVGRVQGQYPVFELVGLFQGRLLLGLGVLLALVLAYGTTLLDPYRGHPADWFAAALFLVAGFAPVKPFLDGTAKVGWAGWALAALCGIASASVVVIGPEYVHHIGGLRFELRMVVLLVLSLGIGAIWIFAADTVRPVSRLLALCPVLLIAAFLFQTSLPVVYAVPQLVALFVYGINTAHLAHSVRGSPQRPVARLVGISETDPVMPRSGRSAD